MSEKTPLEQYCEGNGILCDALKKIGLEKHDTMTQRAVVNFAKKWPDAIVNYMRAFVGEEEFDEAR